MDESKSNSTPALDYHRGSSRPAGVGDQRPGKLEISATKSLVSQRDLSFAYSPGVAEPCMEIEKNPNAVFDYTARGNLVAVVSNGTAVLGLGNIGPLASKPVMEGKAVLFKKFADIDCFDIEIQAKSNEAFVEHVAALEPTFGGINLEDIKAPDCFEIEKALRERVEIPVFHDDQHGTAIISGAAMLNAIELTERKIEKARVVFLGGGAASIACARFWLSLGIQKENVVMVDRSGVIHSKRKEELNSYKAEFINDKSWHKKQPQTLEEAMVGADVLVGCSVGNTVSQKMLQSMNKDPIVFAMANPTPEISYEEALEAREDLIFATGRSDYPNQVNNVLCFPFIFRGALDVRAKTINEEMKIAAAQALAQLAKEVVPESVVNAYGGKPLSYGRQYIIPKPFDPRVLLWVAPAVAEAACKTEIAREEIPGGNLEAYQRRLERLLGKTRSVMVDIRARIRRKSKTQRSYKIVFPEGDNDRILSAAEIVAAEKIAEPILLGNPSKIKERIADLNFLDLADCEIIRPSQSDRLSEYANTFYKMRQRKGLTPQLALQRMKDPFYFASMLVHLGEADVCLGGMSRSYPETIRPNLQVIGAQPNHRISGVYMVVFKQRVVFLTDTTINVEPTTEELANIAINAADVASFLGFEPRVGMLSFSNFGSNSHPEAVKVRKATELVQKLRPNLMVDGEMQADSAVNPAILRERYDFSPLIEKGGANVLVCPNLASANISYKLLGQLGGADLVGPILVGMNKPVHVLQQTSSVNEIVNMAIISVMDAQR